MKKFMILTFAFFMALSFSMTDIADAKKKPPKPRKKPPRHCDPASKYRLHKDCPPRVPVPIAPEPVSSLLFLSGGAALTARHLWKKRRKTE